jgi:hypothetical protein
LCNYLPIKRESTMAKFSFDIKNRWDGTTVFTAEIEAPTGASEYLKMGLAVVAAVKRGANLGGANLGGANLRGANLYGANLRGANLGGANLGGANLGGANLGGANLGGANLSGANLGGANLGGANLRGANLYGANLYGANLGGANLGGANLGGADLGGANLGGANLGGANLYGADLGSQWIIQGQTRSDGYPFFLQKLTDDKEPMVKAGCRLFTVKEAQKHWTATRGGTPLGEETEIIVRSLVRLARVRGLWRDSYVEAKEAA